jgi:hypothetical protein
MKLKYEKMCATIDDNKKLEKCPQIMWEGITSKSLTYTLHLLLYLMMAGCSNSKIASNSGEIVHTRLVDRKTEETVKGLESMISILSSISYNGECDAQKIKRKIEEGLTTYDNEQWGVLGRSWEDFSKRLNTQLEELRAVISSEQKRKVCIDSEKRAALLSQCTTLQNEGNKQLKELAQFIRGLKKIRVTSQEGSLRHSSQKTEQGIDSEQTPRKSDISPSGSRSTQEEKRESVHRPLGQPENNNRPETLQKPLINSPNPSAVSPTQDRGQGLGASEESVNKEEQKDSGESVHTRLGDGETEETGNALLNSILILQEIQRSGRKNVKVIKQKIEKIGSVLLPCQETRWKNLECSWNLLDSLLSPAILSGQQLGVRVLDSEKQKEAVFMDASSVLAAKCDVAMRNLAQFNRELKKIRVIPQKEPLHHGPPKTEQDTDSEKTLKQNNISPSGSHSTQEERKELEEKSLPTVEVVNVKGGATQSSSPRSVIDSQPVSQLSSSVQKENAITTNDNEEPNSALPSVHSTREWYKACEKSLKKFEEIEKKRTGGSS